MAHLLFLFNGQVVSSLVPPGWHDGRTCQLFSTT